MKSMDSNALTDRLNVLQGQAAIDSGLLPQSAVSKAYQSLPPGQELVDWLASQRLISPAQAQQTRLEAQSRLARESANDSNPQDLTSTIRESSSGSRPPSSQHLQPKTPELIGDYKIIKEISRGGMGAVYLAYSLKLQNQVALKTLLAGKLASHEAILRFQLEAQATARLKHPNIVGVHDVGEADGHHFLVMEYIEGQSLKSLIQEQGAIPQRQAAEYSLKLAKALDFAHRRGILHRDIKPDNALLRDHDGEILLTDFGLAKDLSETKDSGLTVTGQIMGTPEFMSPEQADGAAGYIDARSDVFSLGGTLYQMLTGKPPFEGMTLANILKAVMTTDPVSPKKLDPSIDRDLSVIAMKCLEKDPLQRYQSAQELREDLSRYLADEPILAQPPGLFEYARRWRRRHRVALNAVVIPFILAFAALAIPATAPMRREWAQNRELARTREQLNALVKTAQDQWEQKLKQPEAQLSKTVEIAPETLKQWQSRLQELSKHCLSGATERDLEQRLKDAPDWLPKRQAEKLLDATKATLKPRRYAARSASCLSLIATRLKQWNEAEFQRLQALSFDPKSEDSARTLLSLGLRLLKKRQLPQALNVLERPLRSENQELRAQAALASAEAQFRLGQIDGCYALLQRLSRDPLPDQLKDRWQWLNDLSARLCGRVTVEINEFAGLLTAPKHGCLIVSRDPEDDCGLRLDAIKLKDARYQLVLQQRIRTPEPILHASVIDFRGQSGIWLTFGEGRTWYYEWRGQRLERTGSAPAHPAMAKATVLAVGDCNGNGLKDLVVQINGYGQYGFFLDFATQQRQWYQSREMLGHWGYCAAFIDLNSDGLDEVIIGESEWQTMALAIYPGFTGSTPKPAQRTLLGIVTGMTYNHCKTKEPEYLISVDRDIFYDVGVIFGPELSPKLADGLYSISVEQQQPKAVKIHPFSERNQRLYGQARRFGEFFPRYDNHLVYALTTRDNHWKHILTFDIGDEDPLTLPDFPGKFQFIDVDGDGDLEIACVSINRQNQQAEFIALGVKGMSTRPQTSETNETRDLTNQQIELVSTLYEGQQYQQALILTRFLLNNGQLHSTSKNNLRLILAKILLAQNKTREALNAALGVAKSSTLLKTEGLRLAIHCADQLKDYKSALNATMELRKKPRLNLAQSARLKRQQDSYQQLSQARPVIVIDPKTPKLSEQSFELYSPFGAQLTKDGLELTAQSQSLTALELPVSYTGGSFSCHLELELKRFDISTQFELRFDEQPRNPHTPGWHIVIGTSADGDIMTWKRLLRAYRGQHFIENTPLNGVIPRGLAVIDIVYRQGGSVMTMKAQFPHMTIKRSWALKSSLPAGPHTLSLVMRNDGQPMPQSWAGQATVKKLVVAAAKGTFKLDSSRASHAGQAGWALLRHQHEQAAKLYSQAQAAPLKAVDWAHCQFARAVCLARMGQGPQSKSLLADLKQRQPEAYLRLWRQSLHGLGDAEMRVLAALELGSGDLESRITQLKQRGQHEAAALVSVLRSRAIKDIDSCIAWYHVGQLARCRAKLGALQSQLARSGPERDKFQAYWGLLAFHEQRWQEALEAWRDYERWPNTDRGLALKQLVQQARLRAQYLSKQKSFSEAGSAQEALHMNANR